MMPTECVYVYGDDLVAVSGQLCRSLTGCGHSLFNHFIDM